MSNTEFIIQNLQHATLVWAIWWLKGLVSDELMIRHINARLLSTIGVHKKTGN